MDTSSLLSQIISLKHSSIIKNARTATVAHDKQKFRQLINNGIKKYLVYRGKYKNWQHHNLNVFAQVLNLTK